MGWEFYRLAKGTNGQVKSLFGDISSRENLKLREEKGVTEYFLEINLPQTCIHYGLETNVIQIGGDDKDIIRRKRNQFLLESVKKGINWRKVDGDYWLNKCDEIQGEQNGN